MTGELGCMAGGWERVGVAAEGWELAREEWEVADDR